MPLRALRTIALATLAVLSAAAAPVASAAALFNQWSSVNPQPGHYALSVTDTGEHFEWRLTVDPWDAEVLGLFVDLGVVQMPERVDIENLLHAATVSVAARDTPSDSCGRGCNLMGLKLPDLAGGDWELVFQLGSTGFDGVRSFAWVTSNFGLGEADIRLVGLRAQQLCPEGQTLSTGSAAGCNGSDKAWAWPSGDIGPEPLAPPLRTVDPSPPGSAAAPPAWALVLPGLVALLAPTLRRRRANPR